MANTRIVEGSTADFSAPDTKRSYNRFLLLVAGLGGLLYGVDVGIIGGALPYLEATSQLNAGQLSIIVAAVLLGSVISTLFAGLLADWMGRKPLMVLSGFASSSASRSSPSRTATARSSSDGLLQGISGGLIGVVVPLYLAECLSAAHRGKGTGSLPVAADAGHRSGRPDRDLLQLPGRGRGPALQMQPRVFAFKDQAWRRIFWVSLPPGFLFVLGSLFVAESPRWLFARGKKEQAYAALLRSRTPEQADIELKEMEETALAKATSSTAGKQIKDSLLRRKYVIPFMLACVILACNTATGINSIIAYNTNILLQSGFPTARALGLCHLHLRQFSDDHRRHDAGRSQGPQIPFHSGHLRHHCLADRRGIAVSHDGEGQPGLQKHCAIDGCADQTLTLPFDAAEAKRLLAAKGYSGNEINSDRASLAVIYSYGDFTAATSFVRSDDQGAAPIQITRETARRTTK